MALVFSNFERFMRTKICGDSFKSIKSFYVSKEKAVGVRKLRSTRDVLSSLSLRHEKLCRVYFNRYKF